MHLLYGMEKVCWNNFNQKVKKVKYTENSKTLMKENERENEKYSLLSSNN